MPRVGRFQVLAMLEAARARLLGLPEESAESWALNRAIFYAAAKRGFKGTMSTPSRSGAKTEKTTEDEYYLGDEMAYRDSSKPKLYFTIGGKTQTEEDFERQVRARFAGKSYTKAWKEAQAIAKKYDKETLQSAREFFDQVYKPRRDDLSTKWTELSESEMKEKVGKKKK